MSILSKPSRKLASRIVNEVGFEDRIIAYRLRERTGPLAMTLYSFEEVVTFLRDPFPRINFQALQSWINDVMGDGELAEKVKTVINEEPDGAARVQLVRDLMEERLGQSKGYGT
jgi:hypothetical protein